jgi:hypothetical protein
MDYGKMVRLAYDNPPLRGRILRILKAHGVVDLPMEKEAGKGLPLSKLPRYAKTGVFIVSAFRNNCSRRENKLRNSELRERIVALGIPQNKVVKLDSEWGELGSDVFTKEKSMAVLQAVRWEDARKLSDAYDQDGFIWSSPNHPLALYEGKKGTVTFAVDKEMNVQLTVSQANKDDLYSKGRGGSFDIGFNWDKPLKWDGKKPITREDVISALTSEG